MNQAARSVAPLLALAWAPLATEARETPLDVGERAPAVTLSGLDGLPVAIGGDGADTRTVLVVLRGHPGYQCPLCSRQVTEYAAKAAEFAQSGLRVVLVYPGEASDLGVRADEFLAGRTLPAPITMVLDPDYTLTDAYGLRWDAPNETAYPATYVIAPGGEVTWATVSRTHGGRVKAADALAAATE